MVISSEELTLCWRRIMLINVQRLSRKRVGFKRIRNGGIPLLWYKIQSYLYGNIKQFLVNGYKVAIYTESNVGIGFADFMIKETFDPVTQTFLPAYGFFNREEYDLIQPRNCQKILYGIKANSTLNSEMHSTLYSMIYSGQLNFLISEKKAKQKLSATKVGQKMTPEQKIARLMPHELTSILIKEIMNLKVKPTGVSNQIQVEQINKRITKDKFSALEMGTYRISEIENEEISHRQNRGLGRKLIFYRAGGGRH